MTYNEKVQIIIDRIEEHLQKREDAVSMEEIEKIAQCSLNFFQKVFSYMNGISLAEYIRNRKMTLAGYDLKSTSMKVIEISLKYGYESPTSFTKAFSNFHQVTPKEAKRKDCTLRVYPKMQLTQKTQFSWNLLQKDAFTIVGKQHWCSTKHQVHYQQIPALWSAAQKDGTFTHFVELDEANPKGMFGLCCEEDKETQTMLYMMGVISSKKSKDDVLLYIPAMTWAVFDCIGRVPDAIQQGWRFLQEEWYVKYPFAHGNAPELEWYSDGNIFDNAYHSQIWIPIEEVR